ncbi:MAG TPA: transposase, partial [Bacteroidales bacterium]|nr:transposase [Bacteroidales bacterium]
PEISFISPQKEFSLYWSTFLESELGKIYQAIPWQKLIRSLKLKENRKGRYSQFSPQGKLALMFLKSYSGLSDRKLYEHLNGSIQYQLFCGIFLGPEKLRDFKIISKVRTGIANKLNIREVQDVLAKSWKPYIENPNIVLEDATCYESYMRFPTNVKLIWESVDWMYGQMKRTCKCLRIPTPRTKYLEQKDKYFSYMRMRKKPWKQTTKRTRSLLYLLNKLIEELDNIEEQYRIYLQFPEKYYKKRMVIRKVLSQQQEMFTTGTYSVPNRIVSISKSYIRPIVRGKEVKKVEFGAKVNMIQVDGINFIEHLSFDAFNEGPRLIESVRYSRTLFGKITHISADDIYATNANRKWCTGQDIITNFKRKGRAGKHEDHRQIIAAELRKERATRMEGSFGTEKQHYSLDKIKARTEKNEILWIFMGVHTANAVRIAKRMAQEKSSQSVA